MKLDRVEGLPRGFRMDIIAETGQDEHGRAVLNITTGPLRVAWWRTLGRLIGIGRTVELRG